VLLVDIDSQANSSKVLLHDYTEISKEQTIYATIIDRQPLPIHSTHVRNLSIVPSHILLSNTDIELTIAKDHREARLKSALDKIKAGYDYVFIDNPPALGWLTLNSFTASDAVLVVVSPGISSSTAWCSYPRRWTRCGSTSTRRRRCSATCSP
jgi:chromosome partitioning protein